VNTLLRFGSSLAELVNARGQGFVLEVIRARGYLHTDRPRKGYRRAIAHFRCQALEPLGVSANFLAESLRSNGLYPERLAGMKPQDLSDEVKAWKTVWSAGQGVGSVNEILPATELCRKLIQEYKAAHAQLTPPFS